jgi:hypothetical protein
MEVCFVFTNSFSKKIFLTKKKANVRIDGVASNGDQGKVTYFTPLGLRLRQHC